MEESFPFHSTLLDFLLTLLGLFLFLLDVGLDVWTVVSFYQDGAYWYMAVLIFLLLGSSVLLQVFSWLWYSDGLDQLETRVENFVNGHKLIKPFHFMQLGVYLRYAGVVEISTCRLLRQTDCFYEGVTVVISHDLQMLRLIETFSESAPQLTLMISIIVHRGELTPITGLKTLASAAAIACNVVMYHRCMRACLPEKRQLGFTSSFVYFLWNLVLIIVRVIALALFSSVLPCYIVTHFISVWMLLVLVAWSQKTDFMEIWYWEWLYRATVGLIWYFSWFNIAKGNTKIKSIVYYVVMGLDTMVLLGLWCWKTVEQAGCLKPFDPYIVIPVLLVLYFFGIGLKITYYRCLHPNCVELERAEPHKLGEMGREPACYEETDSAQETSPEAPPPASPAQPITGVNKRMRTMAANFYS
ncbi:XK-related protein 8-like [Myxocyprinus asiaticus]|uniref:XK-related protein 8-like n=1 Tax=Myxocyprinus asiaticus TaxID=70543 RepID=UPI002222079D|nr:XK-related protein 8-like [Myxocyprinus asiaticus]